MGSALRDVLDRILPQTKVVALIDRDDMSHREIGDYEGIVLARRNIESYLLDDEVIEALLNREGKPELRDAALQIKATAIQNSISRGNPSDDLKSAVRDIYVELKQLLGLQHPGNNKDSFMRDTLSTLIVPGMETYKCLKSDIVDKIRRL